MTYADLHLHTLFSDGTYTPEELVEKAKAAGLCCISVVDHDTVSGIERAAVAAESAGIELIPGIEMTAEYSGKEIHMLGYFVDYRNKVLGENLKLLKQRRIERIYMMLDKLKGIGIKLKAEAIFSLAAYGTIGRLHVARALVNQGFVNSTSEAFSRIIGDDCPAYVLGFKLLPQEAVKLIRQAGGVPVLAHPFTLRDDALIPGIIECGIMGIEALYPEHTNSKKGKYIKLAQEHNLLVTGGSDFHGDAKPQLKLGSFRVPYDLVEKMKAARVKE